MGTVPRIAALIQGIPQGGEVESPLPGGVAAVVRFFLSFPRVLQIAGLVVGVILLGVLLVVSWRRRADIEAWVRRQRKEVYIAAGALAFAFVVAVAAVGAWGWNYVEHENEFCTGCHVMRPAFVRFTESEHSQMECHDCHQQPITASMRQLALWVAERPEEVGPHAPVENDVCVQCHVQEDADDSWENIRRMQGHEVHLESDSSTLADVQCVTCHGRELHRFVPTRDTCGQSGCHGVAETRMALGDMAGDETPFHCLACHHFTEPAAGAPREALMVPSMEDCAGCHEMQVIIDSIIPADDPHEGQCAACHNPHDQEQVAGAWDTCAGSGCHEDPQSLTGFHRGVHSEEAVPDCSQCHQPHTWELDGTDCMSCHTMEELSD